MLKIVPAIPKIILSTSNLIACHVVGAPPHCLQSLVVLNTPIEFHCQLRMFVSLYVAPAICHVRLSGSWWPLCLGNASYVCNPSSSTGVRVASQLPDRGRIFSVVLSLSPYRQPRLYVPSI